LIKDEADAVAVRQARVASDEMNWDAYAEHYDEMCALNPAYQQNIDNLLSRMSTWNLPQNATICDLGAGTGNYILQISKLLPDAEFWHVDFDSRMVELANAKYQRHNVVNVRIVKREVHEVSFPDESFDLIVSINALYAFTQQEEIFAKMRRWLKPQGKLFLIDFGRKQNTLDWTLYIFRESIKAHRMGRYAKALLEAREVLKQNRKTSKGQESGRYWLHSTQEFGDTLTRAGFAVEELRQCYRDYADLAICSKLSS
jgi:ubiquinone/menaquinone biosynthesis C-methylase UbiE